jgi:hypothetical protein
MIDGQTAPLGGRCKEVASRRRGIPQRRPAFDFAERAIRKSQIAIAINSLRRREAIARQPPENQILHPHFVVYENGMYENGDTAHSRRSRTTQGVGFGLYLAMMLSAPQNP